VLHTRSPERLSGGGGVELIAKQIKKVVISHRTDLTVSVVDSRYWEETEDAECEGVEAGGCDNAANIAEGSPTS